MLIPVGCHLGKRVRVSPVFTYRGTIPINHDDDSILAQGFQMTSFSAFQEILFCVVINDFLMETCCYRELPGPVLLPKYALYLHSTDQ